MPNTPRKVHLESLSSPYLPACNTSNTATTDPDWIMDTNKFGYVPVPNRCKKCHKQYEERMKWKYLQEKYSTKEDTHD